MVTPTALIQPAATRSRRFFQRRRRNSFNFSCSARRQSFVFKVGLVAFFKIKSLLFSIDFNVYILT